MSLITWQNVGVGAVGRLANIKQYYEIQVYQSTPPVFIYMRRRITLVTIQFEIDYLEAIPPGSLAKSQAWLTNVNIAAPYDWVAAVTWKESGSATVNSISVFDNDGLGNKQSGVWLVDVKDISATGDSSATVMITFRNEGAWVIDSPP